MARKTEETGARSTGAAASRLEITEIAPETPKETAARTGKALTRGKTPGAKPKAAARRATRPVAKAETSAAKTKAPAAKALTTAPAKRKAAVGMRKAKKKASELLEVPAIGDPVVDPIGDVSDGEARSSTSAETQPEPNAEMAAYRAETADDAIEGTLEAQVETRAEPEEGRGSGDVAVKRPKGGAKPPKREKKPPEASTESQSEPPAKLERLQKILSKAGIASRRRAEAMIEAGRVMVNGTVVTQLGTKADAGRDHIRVDGKMLEGAEHHRYFVLNKPRGFVTTVSDPEHRPTVMQFFEKMRERLYPVGRLDYMTEGLLVVTNDGDLANQLTKASSGVEKTYLVKVAGQPTEEELDLLRAGVRIERGKPGSAMVKTSPAQVRQVRHGDNPWYEVILIEGRNRELRKMFEQIGHFVEKIRRVGYGPLVLDLEPGKLRELEPEEVARLRLAAEGKLKARRVKTSKLLPREAGRAVEPIGAERPDPRAPRPAGTWTPRPGGQGTAGRPGERPFKAPSAEGRPFREQGREQGSWKPREERPRPSGTGEKRTGARPPFGRAQSARPGGRFDRPQGQRFGARPGSDKPRGESSGGRSAFSRPEGERPDGEQRRFGARPGGERTFRDRPGSDAGPKARFDGRGASFRPQQREQEPRLEETPRKTWDKQGERPAFKRQDGPKKRFDRPAGKSFGKAPGRGFDKPAGRSFGRAAGREFSKAPAKSFEGRPAARFDKAPGKTWSKGPAKTWDKGEGERPSRPSGSSPAFRGKPGPGGTGRPAAGGRPKPAFGSKPAFRSKPAFGSKPGFKSRPSSGSKPGGFKRSKPRPGGSRPGGRNRS